MYEDIAKLNPFYEVYENFWNTDSEESSLTFSSRGSSDSARSPSLASITSSQDSFRPLEISSSPSIRHFRSHLDLDETKKIQVFLHEGSEHQPTYAEYDGQSSQFAALDYADNDKRPLSPIEEPEDSSDSDELEPDLRPKVHPSKYPHKKLFGQDGWLGCSTDVHALPLEKRTSMVFKGIGNKIKKQVGEIVSFPSILGTSWISLTTNAGRRHGKSLPKPFQFCSSPPFKIVSEPGCPRLLGSCNTVQTVLRPGGHDLSQRQRLPSPTTRRRPSLGRVDQEDQQLLGIQKPAASCGVPL